MSIHELAVVHESAVIHKDANIGPFVVIGENVVVGASTIIEAHSVVHKNTILGTGNTVGSYVSLGGASQSKHDKHDDDSALIIGNNNSIHEFCTINRGSIHASKKTIIGNDNTLMAYVHIGHDCLVKNNCVFVNQATVAGHANIMDNAIIGYAVAIRQFCQIGHGAFINGGSLVVKDVLPYMIVQANPTRVIGINKIGLERMQFNADQIAEIKECFRIVFRRNLSVQEALQEISSINSKHYAVANIIAMLKDTERGLVR